MKTVKYIKDKFEKDDSIGLIYALKKILERSMIIDIYFINPA